MQLEEIKSIVKSEYLQVERLIGSGFTTHITFINEVSSSLIKSGGKRLRPLVVLLCTRALGYKDNQHIPIAAAIELIHSATLFHDDVIDDSILRRGEKTANYIWGNEAAVLIGDFLYSKACQLIVNSSNKELLRILANATNIITTGEILQLLNQKNQNLTEETYFEIIRTKTAKLFEAAAELSAVLTDSSSETRITMTQYGLHLGIAFQIIDDLLDYQDNSNNKLGKNIGDDFAKGKLTLPIIYLLKNGSQKEKTFIEKAIKNGDVKSFGEVQNTILNSNAIEYTINIAKQEASLAKNALTTLNDSTYKDAAMALVDFVVNRTH